MTKSRGDDPREERQKVAADRSGNGERSVDRDRSRSGQDGAPRSARAPRGSTGSLGASHDARNAQGSRSRASGHPSGSGSGSGRRTRHPDGHDGDEDDRYDLYISFRCPSVILFARII